MRSLEFSLLLFMLGAASCRPTTLIDLTYSFASNKTPTYPGNKIFEVTKMIEVDIPAGGIRFAIHEFATSEHSGTHMDAPYHVLEGTMTIDELPLDHFEGPAVVINITDKASEDPDAQVTMEDVNEWEEANGLIENNSIVLMNSGWGKFWDDPVAYSGSNDTKNLHFPGIHSEVCEFLFGERSIYGIGSDTASVDNGPSTTFPCHKFVSQAGGFILENVANVHLLPSKGAIIRAYPMKIAGGTGAPARVLASLDGEFYRFMGRLKKQT